MRVLITGGAGFIGSHLAEECLRRGYDVLILDDLSTGSRLNIAPLLATYGPKLSFYHDTVLNDGLLDNLIRRSDTVVHLAAAVGVDFILKNPLASFKINIQGTENVLDVCNKYKRQVLIASTSEVYGKRKDAPLDEMDDCVYGPSSKFRWSYAGSKLMDEFYALAYYRDESLPVIIMRFFNTVGPRQSGNYGMVIPRLVGQALKNKPITVYGDGSQTRTFTHVLEVVECILRLMLSPQASGEVVNIGGVEEVSILEVAKRIKEKTQSTSEIKLIPYNEVYPKDFEDMLRRVPSTAKLKSLIGFAPTGGLDKILDDVIEYQRSMPLSA